MKTKYVKLRPANQSLIKDSLNSSLLEILKITQKASIMSNEIDNLFRCKKVYKFADGEKVYIPKIVTKDHNLYSFLAHVLTDIDLNEPIPHKTVNCIFKSVELVKKAILLDFNEDNLALLHQLNKLSSLHKEI
tara:strand:+ start:3896 stop:4294 length:399 start_codon:yes stop_codon:yes gene_type:complete